MMRTIVITGPESTGKTTLARQLSSHYDSPWVPEFAVEYLEQIERPYVYSDLLAIARGHQDQIDQLQGDAFPYLFCDTDLINLLIWSEFRYGRVDPWIRKKAGALSVDLYLLCDIDLPWEPHPLREHPHLREELFELHEQALKDLNKPYAIISGASDERFQQAVRMIERRDMRQKYEVISTK